MNEIEIANLALVLIGGEQITSLTDGSTEAQLMNSFFYPSLETLLQEHPWNFALKRAALALSVDTPVYDYAYAYVIPSDCLRIIDFDGSENGYEYKVEQGLVLTNCESCKITYIENIRDMNKLSPMFRQALIAYLGAELAPYLTNTAAYAQGALQQFVSYMRKAKVANARESHLNQDTDGSWLTVRK